MALELAYQDRGTIIHRLDPRVKLLWWLSINVTLATWNDPIFLFLLLLFDKRYGRRSGYRHLVFCWWRRDAFNGVGIKGVGAGVWHQ